MPFFSPKIDENCDHNIDPWSHWLSRIPNAVLHRITGKKGKEGSRKRKTTTFSNPTALRTMLQKGFWGDRD
jgi:hypothetical protein